MTETTPAPQFPLRWHRLSEDITGGKTSYLLAAASCDGIGVMARWRLEVDGSYRVEALDTEGEKWEAVTRFDEDEGDCVPLFPPPTCDKALAQSEAKAASLQAQILAWENREAACCPEDVGFEEVIRQLEAKAERLEALLPDILQWIEPQGDRDYELPQFFHVEGFLVPQDLTERIKSALAGCKGGRDIEATMPKMKDGTVICLNDTVWVMQEGFQEYPTARPTQQKVAAISLSEISQFDYLGKFVILGDDWEGGNLECFRTREEAEGLAPEPNAEGGA